MHSGNLSCLGGADVTALLLLSVTHWGTEAQNWVKI